MNKKFLSAILFGALMVTSTGTFVSCKDYDDDIDAINKELTDIKSQIASLQSKVDAGNYVTNITKAEGGINVAFSNGTTSFVATGAVVETEECYESAATIVDGEWVINKADGTSVETGIPASGVLAVKNNKGGYTLTVVDAEGETTEIELPATKVITSLTAGTVNAAGKFENAINVYYGIKVDTSDDKGLTFNGKTYAEGTYLLSQDATLSAIVNPLEADATKYAFKLVDSKGNAPFIVSDIKQNMTEAAISRADKTANQGVWDMTLAYADATKVAVSGSYALTTETVNGTVASPYDLKLTANNATSVPSTLDLAAVSGNCNADIDLRKSFNEKDWAKYIVDYYFEIPDKTAATAAGVSLNGNMIKRTINSSLSGYTNIKVYFLMVNSLTPVEKTITVNFAQVAPTQTLADIEWTINNTNKIVYLSLASIQSQLAGSADTSIPAISNEGATWADGTALNEKSVLVNGVNYGKADDNTATTDVTFDATWITSLSTTLKSKNAAGTDYENASSIQKEMFAVFTFDETKAFPGEYIVKVGFRKDGATTGDFALVVPVKVTIKAPTQTIVKYDNYFSGDNAVAYGTADGTYATYKLTDLFKTTGLTFTETEVKNANNVAYPTWMTTVTEGGVSYPAVKVPVYLYGDNVDNTITVGSTREYTASIIPFNNAHIQKTEYTFNLTVKSAINEGTFSSEASKTIETSEPVEFAVTDFTATDVYGDAFYIANTYKYDSANKVYTNTVENAFDANRITSVTISAADDNATNYLDFATAFSHTSGKATDTFSVARKSGLTQLVADTECKLNVTILDKWGVKTTTTVTVVLKKFGN